MHGSAQVPGEAHEQELQRLMDAYSGTLMGVCIVLLRDHHQAQDVVLETFVKAWRTGRLRPGGGRADRPLYPVTQAPACCLCAACGGFLMPG